MNYQKAPEALILGFFVFFLLFHVFQVICSSQRLFLHPVVSNYIDRWGGTGWGRVRKFLSTLLCRESI